MHSCRRDYRHLHRPSEIQFRDLAPPAEAAEEENSVDGDVDLALSI